MQHHPEGLAHLASIDVGFGKATHPEIDAVDALDRVAVHQLDVGIRRLEGRNVSGCQHKIRIGLLELGDHRITEPVALLEVLPRGIGREVAGVAHGFPDIGIGRIHQVGADLIHRAEANVAATCDVEGSQVGADVDEVVADRIHEIEINLFRLLAGNAAQDVAGAKGAVGRRIEERGGQRHLHVVAVGILDGQRVGNQRVADTVDRGSEFVADAGVGIGVVVVEAMVAGATDAADEGIGKFREHHALILCFVQHAGRLEQLFGRAREAGIQKVLDMEVVVPRPDRVDRSERHVLIDAAIARHDVVEDADAGVRIEHEVLAGAHEVARQCLCLDGIDNTCGHKARIGVTEGDGGTIRVLEDGVVLPVMQDRRTQRGQQVEAWR